MTQAEAVLHFKQNPFTDQDLTAAQAGLDQARAHLDLAELGMRDTTVIAPVDGVISERLAAPGALFSPQTLVVTLVLPALELMVDVEQSHLRHLDAGETVQIQVDAFPDQTFTGTITSVSPTVDSRSRTAPVRIQPQDNSHLLRAGLYSPVTIAIGAHDNVLLVPKTALLDAAAGSPATVVTLQDGMAERRSVTIGFQNVRFVEVLNGLSDGDLVATSGLADIANREHVIARTGPAT